RMRKAWICSIFMRVSPVAPLCRYMIDSWRGGAISRCDITASAAVAQQPALFPVPVARLFGLALVVQLLALGEREFDLGAAAIVEIDLERHQRHALARNAGAQAIDLLAGEQQ